MNRAGPPSGTSAFDNFAAYAAACKRGEVAIGRMFVWSNAHGERPACIANVPTKRHWRQPSRLEDVEAGLDGSRCSTSSALDRSRCRRSGSSGDVRVPRSDTREDLLLQARTLDEKRATEMIGRVTAAV